MCKLRTISMVLFFILLLFPLNVGADRSGGKSVVLVDDGQKQVVQTDAETVGAFLAEQTRPATVRRVFPDRSSPLISGTHVFIYRKSSPETTQTKTVKAQTINVRSWALPEGREMEIRGQRDGVRTSEGVTREPVNQMVLQGQADHKNKRINQLRKQKTLTLMATGYSPHALDTAPYDDGISALGLPAGYGIVAVDPRVIPLGTRLYVEGYGYAIAADVGGDIKGKRIDLCFPDRKDALIFGRRWLKVHILE